MLLQRLREYAERMDLPPALYAEGPVRYLVDLDTSGRRRPALTDTADPASPRTRRGVRRLVPQVQRAVGIKPLLLADNAEYTFGLPRDTSRPARVVACHTAYVELLDRCVVATREPTAQTVAAFLRDDPLGQLPLPPDFDRGAMITFRVDDAFPIDVPAVQAFWASVHDPAAAVTGATVMQCLICGEARPVLDRLQAKLKGVPGGQMSGTALISANASAFESYGLEASRIAPTCAACGERFTRAANALLASEQNRMFLANAAFVFWTREPVDFSWRDYFDQPDPAQVQRLLASVRTGGRLPRVDETAFYATVLSGSGGRAVVRDWIDTTVGEARRHLATWFTRQDIVDAAGDAGRPLGLYALAAATVRDPRTDLAPPTLRSLLRAALLGAPLPMELLYQAVRRSRAEQGITRPRAALIKLVRLSRQPDAEEDTMVQLDSRHPSAAYQCGRLLAVLEEVQRGALGNVSATIVDRFYGTASSAPASVFGRLLRGAQPHLARLERDRRGAYLALQGRLEEVLGALDSFPRTLTLEDQGLFALGYYHQRAHDRAEARRAAERRRAGPTAIDDDLPADIVPSLTGSSREEEN